MIIVVAGWFAMQRNPMPIVVCARIQPETKDTCPTRGSTTTQQVAPIHPMSLLDRQSHMNQQKNRSTWGAVHKQDRKLALPICTFGRHRLWSIAVFFCFYDHHYSFDFWLLPHFPNWFDAAFRSSSYNSIVANSRTECSVPRCPR